MAHKFWRSETLIVWLQYFAAGIAMIPAGIVYVAMVNRWGERKAFSLSLVFAMIIGLAIWTLVGHSLRLHFLNPVKPALVAAADAQTSTEEGQNIYADRVILLAGSIRFDNVSGKSNTIQSLPFSGRAVAHSTLG